MKFNSTLKIYELNLRIWIQFKLHVMSFNISITINIIFTKSSIFFHHFIVIDIACSKHIAPKFCNNISPLQNYTLFEHKESTFLVLQTCPHGWTKGIYIHTYIHIYIYIYTHHARTGHFTWDVPLEWPIPMFGPPLDSWFILVLLLALAMPMSLGPYPPGSW
jgi:hypothetical protein